MDVELHKLGCLHINIKLKLVTVLLNSDPQKKKLLQLGQLSVIPPGLVLEAGGDFNLASSDAC